MTTFTEASQARLVLKMKLSNYAWYKGCSVVTDDDGFAVLVDVTRIDNSVRKIVPQVYSGVLIKTELRK